MDTNPFPNPLTENFIVFAEDDIDDQELLIDALKNLLPSIKIQTVTNGNKAISLLKELPEGVLPCLIVLDYNLPEVNGAEILHFLNSTGRFEEVIKIVWSTSNSPVYEKKCLELGAKAYMVKPNDIAGIDKMARLMLEYCHLKV